MGDKTETKAQLIDELSGLRRKVAELEEAEKEYKEALDLLRKNRQQFQALVETTSDLAWEVDKDGIFTYVSPKIKDLLGYEAEEVLGKRPFDFMSPDDAARIASLFHDVITSSKLFSGLENVKIHKDGRLITLETSGIPVFDDKGDFSGYTGIDRDITDRKRAEEDLKTTKDYLRAVFNNVYDAIIVHDGEGRFIDVNDKMLELYGATREDVTGGYIFDGSAGDIPLDKMVTIWQKVLSGEDQFFEWKARRPKDGSIFDVEVFITRLSLPRGDFVLANIRDVTTHKQMEQALRESEERFKGIANNLPGVVFQAYVKDNGERGMYFVHERAEDVCGLKADPVEDWATRFEACVAPEDKEKWFASLAEGARTGSPWDAEAKFIKPTGEEIYIRGISQPRRLKNEVVWNGILLDVTAHRRAEEEIRTAHQRLFDIIEFLPDATFVIDAEKRIVAWNLACEEMTGVKKEQVAGKGKYAYAIPFFGESRPMLIDYVTLDSEILDENYGSVRKNGHLLYGEAFAANLRGGKGAFLSSKASPLFDGKGNVVGAIESVRDITEVRQLEAQLSHSKKLESIGTLAGGIAHDFNNILTALIGYATLLRMNIDSAMLCSYVDEILAASEKATDLVSSLLAFSKQQAISLKPVSLHNIIRGTEKLLKRLVTEDINFKTLLAAQTDIVIADPTQIDQILFNLVSNARDAMPRGGILTIETKTVELSEEFKRLYGYGEAGRYVLLSISDTGVGMEEITRERIFDPFFTTKEAGKGTGLGLSTVYGIVRQHNGYITVYSEPNIGTTFHIYLPSAGEINKKEESVSIPAEKGSETILVAEDNAMVRGLICTILAGKGYTPVEAIDGEDAVAKFANTDNVDLLILDSVMPKRNGREAYNEILKINPHIKVIFISGYTRDVFLDKGIEDGELNFLQKPILPEVLLRKVREVLEACANRH